LGLGPPGAVGAVVDVLEGVPVEGLAVVLGVLEEEDPVVLGADDDEDEEEEEAQGFGSGEVFVVPGGAAGPGLGVEACCPNSAAKGLFCNCC